jgi:hypothetical protein
MNLDMGRKKREQAKGLNNFSKNNLNVVGLDLRIIFKWSLEVSDMMVFIKFF